MATARPSARRLLVEPGRHPCRERAQRLAAVRRRVGVGQPGSRRRAGAPGRPASAPPRRRSRTRPARARPPASRPAASAVSRQRRAGLHSASPRGSDERGRGGAAVGVQALVVAREGRRAGGRRGRVPHEHEALHAVLRSCGTATPPRDRASRKSGCRGGRVPDSRRVARRSQWRDRPGFAPGSSRRRARARDATAASSVRAVSAPDRLTRPPTPPGFDASRAAERAADPRGWRYDDDARDAVYRVIAERRDIRRFRPDPVPEDVLRRVLAAAHRAPSVGLMQPWRFIVVRERERPASPCASSPSASACARPTASTTARASSSTRRSRAWSRRRSASCVCCDHGDPDAEVLGRGTIPETDVYSTACAIENLWLAARAEGLGVGWVSFYRPDDLRALFGIPARVDPMAYLCVGWPDERPVRPGLEAAGWSERAAAGRRRHGGALGGGRRPTPDARRPAPDRAAADRRARPPRRAGQARRQPGRARAADRALGRDRRARRRPPRIRAGVLVCAADHGHVAHGTSLFDGDGLGPGRRRGRARRDRRRGARARAAATSCWSPTSACAARPRPACATPRSPTGTADMLARARR